jgi:hypothetical protein
LGVVAFPAIVAMAIVISAARPGVTYFHTITGLIG